MLRFTLGNTIERRVKDQAQNSNLPNTYISLEVTQLTEKHGFKAKQILLKISLFMT